MENHKINNFVIDDIPVYSQDKYWGKVSESELKDVIDKIDKNGFEFFDLNLQKKFDFTLHEDRADWRFYLPLNKESKVLDLGAGLGRITIPLLRVCGKVVAVDQSLSRMRFLKRRVKYENLPNVEVLVADVFNLPFKEESFDLIVMNGVLEWVGMTDLFKNPREAQIKSLEICRRLLKPEGNLYIGIENRFALAYLKAFDHGGLRFTSYMPRWKANFYSKLRGYGPYRTYTYSKRGYEKLLKKAGFNTSNDFYLVYPGYNLPQVLIPYNNILAFRYLIQIFNKPNSILKRFIYKLIKTPFIIQIYRFFFYSFSIIAKK